MRCKRPVRCSSSPECTQRVSLLDTCADHGDRQPMTFGIDQLDALAFDHALAIDRARVASQVGARASRHRPEDARRWPTRLPHTRSLRCFRVDQPAPAISPPPASHARKPSVSGPPQGESDAASSTSLPPFRPPGGSRCHLRRRWGRAAEGRSNRLSVKIRLKQRRHSLAARKASYAV